VVSAAVRPFFFLFFFLFCKDKTRNRVATLLVGKAFMDPRSRAAALSSPSLDFVAAVTWGTFDRGNAGLERLTSDALRGAALVAEQRTPW